MTEDEPLMCVWTKLKITGPDDILSIREGIRERPALAEKIRAIEVKDDVDEQFNKRRQGKNEFSNTSAESDFLEPASAVAEVLYLASKKGNLETFIWCPDDTDSASDRPEAFWKALAANALTLKVLKLGFYDHEIHNLKEADVDLFPIAFQNLKDLTLDMRGGHGDNALRIDSLLFHLANLERLEITIPGCDLESCRLQGLSYDWTFPHLASFHIYGYLDTGALFTEFLARHPQVSTLTLRVEHDEDAFKIPPTLLPNIQALEVGDWYRDTNSITRGMFSEEARRPISYLMAPASLANSFSELAKLKNLHTLVL